MIESEKNAKDTDNSAKNKYLIIKALRCSLKLKLKEARLT